jgi:hypothetical protein
MLMRIVGVLCLTLLMAAPILADERSSGGSGWRPATGKESPIRTVATDGATIGSQITLVSKGEGTLPNDHGQVWREYDISPYSSRVTTTQRPEQAIVDWILRETGTDVWFSEPLGLLNASHNTLRVYHTPEMQRLVLDIVDRFVSSQAESHAFSLRMVTVGSPNWRTTAISLLQPVDVRAPGVDAWLLSKENAAVLLGQLRKRTDFRELNSPSVLIHNGQSHTVSHVTPQNYVRSVRMRQDVWPGHELEMGQLEDGYSLQFSPLISLDGKTIDAVIKCHIDQVEKLVPVAIDVPSLAGGMQRVQIQVPQVVAWRLHERFRWPASQVLVLGCGVVATPTGEKLGPLGLPLPSIAGIPLPVSSRADALLFIESKGKASGTLLEAQRRAADGNPSYHGRY